jgi:translation initiation factor 2 beta subunit (eIF-2beta)/eIF-5
MSATKPLKSLMPKSADTKYTGPEPEWRAQPDSENRVGQLSTAFAWYNYHYDKKDAKELIIDWLARNDRLTEAKHFQKVPDGVVSNTIGWMTRMNLKGLELTEHELLTVETRIKDAIEAVKAVKEVVEKASDEVQPYRPTIQDRLREKMQEAAGELEGMYDDMIVAGAKTSADFKPITLLRSLNVAPQFISEITNQWKRRVNELEEVIEGRDADLVEGYSQFSKQQVKNLLKFSEQVLADCSSYVQVKKVERKPRKKKPVSPEKLTAKFKYLKEFTELKLTSDPVTKLIGASEAWFYETKKRKLIHVVADQHVGSFSVKGSGLIGFDATNSVQKTLRKPAEQIKALLAGGAPAARKYFKEIKATEIKFNGRGNENTILLRIR